MIGTRLGQYRLDALLGQGGMGAVYLATDEMLGRQVAVKVLRQDAVNSPTALERFRKEAQILARLDHPHILRLHGFSRDADVLYMVTQYVEGESLLRRLEREAVVDLPQALGWAREALDALEYAHAVGVVHRDIKPGNILIDPRGRVLLLDFGIARLVEDDSLTQTGHAVGTLSYMAPEQVLDEPVDGRADLYAFAIVFCQMLAGRRPWRSGTAAGLVREIVDGPTPEVSALLPAIAAPFVPVLQQALSRRPDDRYPTAAQFRAALDDAADAAGVVARPTPLSGATPLPPLTLPALGGPTSSASMPAYVSRTSETTADVPPPVPPQPASTRWLPIGAGVLLLLVVGAFGWAMAGRPRLVVQRPVAAPAQPVGPVAADTTRADAAVDAPIVPAGAGPSDPSPAPGSGPPAASEPPSAAPQPQRPRPMPVEPAATSAPAHTVRPPASPPAPAPDTAAPAAAPAPSRTTGRSASVVEFRDLILVDKVDDENEEFDVHLRLERRRVIVLDEDEVPMKTMSIDAVHAASYRTTKPGRFSLRRGLRHWLTLDTSSGPLVFRLNSRTYEQVLAALEDRGLSIVGAP